MFSKTLFEKAVATIAACNLKGNLSINSAFIMNYK